MPTRSCESWTCVPHHLKRTGLLCVRCWLDLRKTQENAICLLLSMQLLASFSRNGLLTYRHSKKIRIATFMSNMIPKAYDLLIAVVRFWIPGVIAVVAVFFRTFVAGISPMFFTYIKRTSRYQYGDFLIIAEITDGTGFESSAAPKWVSVKLNDR